MHTSRCPLVPSSWQVVVLSSSIEKQQNFSVNLFFSENIKIKSKSGNQHSKFNVRLYLKSSSDFLENTLKKHNQKAQTTFFTCFRKNTRVPQSANSGAPTDTGKCVYGGVEVENFTFLLTSTVRYYPLFRGPLPTFRLVENRHIHHRILIFLFLTRLCHQLEVLCEKNAWHRLSFGVLIIHRRNEPILLVFH